MIAHHGQTVHRDVHRAKDGAGAVRFAGVTIAPDFEDAEQVADPQQCAVWAGIFAPRALDKERQTQGDAQDGQPGSCRLAVPEVEQGEIRIVLGKDQFAGHSGHIQHPGQHAVAQVAQPSVQFDRDEMVETPLEMLTTEFTHKLLDGAQRANPAAKHRPKQDRQQKDGDHQDKGALVDLLHKAANREKLVDRYHPTERADCMQAGVCHQRDAAAIF